MAEVTIWRYEAEQGILPKVCICCGGPAISLQDRYFSRQAILLQTPLCSDHLGFWARLSLLQIVERSGLVFIVLGNALLLIRFEFEKVPELLIAGVFAMLLFWAWARVVGPGFFGFPERITAKESDGRTLRLVGVDADFSIAVANHRILERDALEKFLPEEAFRWKFKADPGVKAAKQNGARSTSQRIRESDY